VLGRWCTSCAFLLQKRARAVLSRAASQVRSVENISTGGPLNCRSLHFATPDFLWNLVASVHFMRPSLRKGAHAALSGAAWQEIRVRSGRDDTSVRNGRSQLEAFYFSALPRRVSVA
jgi:hypothetical protein